MDPQEEVMKRLQGIKDARGPVGQMARGNNMYPGGAQARTGGGPGIGRPPTAVPPQALAALQQHLGMAQQQAPQPGAAVVSPGSVVSANPQQAQQEASLNRAMSQKQAGGLAKAALQAAAKRRLQRR